MNVKTLAFALASTLALGAFAADYYVGGDNASDENDGSSSAPFATLDKAFATGGGTKGNNIYVRAGTYSTNQQYGYDLKANLIGDAATRDEVVIQSSGNYRTLRMNATDKPTVTKVTIVGCTDISKVDKGGAIEMNGGTLRDCVIRDGKTYGNSSNLDGGNIYVNGDSLIEDCVITGGEATKRGGNVYLDNGTIRNCTISGGSCKNTGGNVFQYKGTIENCTISGGTSVNDGGNVRLNGAGTLRDSVIRDGVVTANNMKGANVAMDNGVLSRNKLIGGVNTAYNSGSLCIKNSACAVEDCLVVGSHAGGILLEASNSKVYNTTVIANEKYGVWSWNVNQTLVNCIIYANYDGSALKEWAGNQPIGTSAVFLNCATTEGALSQVSSPTLVSVSADDFVDFASGDYSPREGGALVDAGTSDPRGASASATDLNGNPRMSGTIDIGCFEYQKQDMTIRLETGTYSQIWAPTTVTFTHVVEHSVLPENVVVTYDFGDGSEPVSTKEPTIAHDYAQAGVYTVKLTATNECEEERAEMVYEGYVRVASSTVYVNPGNVTAQFPYTNLVTGCASLKTAVAEAYDGYELRLGPGVYENIDQYSITKALKIVGTGETPECVVLRNTASSADIYYHRAFEIRNAAVWLENVTLENGKVRANGSDQYGGCLRMEGGTVTNCVIRGGLAVTDGSYSSAGAGVAICGNNCVLTHCVISNCVVQGTSKEKEKSGGAIFVEKGRQHVHLSNLLIAGNVYQSTDGAKSGAAGVRYGGSNDWTTMENCTVVGNAVTGTALPEDSAAVYCTSWHVLFYNNIFAGNVEVEKDGGKATSVAFTYDGGSGYKYMHNITDDVVIGGSATKSIGNTVAKPAVLFKDFAKGDYTLRTTSPACNKGTQSGLVLLPSVDLLGNSRIFDVAGKNRIDIGCYECQKASGFTASVR